MTKSHLQCILNKAIYTGIKKISSKTLETKANKVFQIYDSDNDGFLYLENFISFFKDEAFKNQQKIWKMLAYFGYDSELNATATSNL